MTLDPIAPPAAGGLPNGAPAARSAARAAEHEGPLDAGPLRSLFTLLPDPVLALDVAGRVDDANAAAAAMLARGGQALRGTQLLDVVAPADRERSAERMAAALAGAPQRWEAELLTPDARRTAHLTAIPMLVDGVVTGAYVLARDVTAHRTLELQLAHRAFHDPLTGLANGALFRERLEQALARDPAGDHVAVIFVDLDDFKKVNDTLGHAAGDELLQQVAELLLESTRGCDAVARLSGDEFAVLLERIAHPDHATAVTARVQAALRRRVALRGRQLMVSASVGMAPGRAGMTAADLMREADLAMYRAKNAQKGRAGAYDAGVASAAEEAGQLQADLERALLGDPAGGTLALAFQPVVDLVSGRVVACEALTRWQHPTRGEVTPSVFVPLAEESGLILELGRWVLRTACAQLRAWEHALPAALVPRVSINLSRAELDQPTLLRDVADVLDATGVQPAHLLFELPESAVMRRPDDAVVTLHALRELGVGLAIDGFGAGVSSLGHLQRMPVDQIKIDRAYVGTVPEDANAAAVIRTIVALGHALRLRTVAAGIERADQCAYLADVGCELGQGFLFARPGPAQLAEAMLRADPTPVPRAD